jgi:hypothetical protein
MPITASYGLILAFLAAVSGPTTSGLKRVATIPPETLTTSTSYDDASRKLTVICDHASRGLCRFTIVDGSRTENISLRSKTQTVLANVSRKARVCAVGKNPNVACDLMPVSNR